MSLSFRWTGSLAIAVTLALPFSVEAGPGKSEVDDCAAVGRKVRADIAKTPSALLPIVQKAIAANEDCACEVVRAAVLAADSDPAMVREIVITALTTAESRAAEIAECAVIAAPDAVDAVKSALYAVYEGEPPEVGDTNSIHGIFLVPPQPSSPTNPGP